MERLATIASLALLAAGVAACDGPGSAHAGDALAAERAARAAELLATPRRAGPDPAAVYAVPVAGAPFRGPEHAPVTMVYASTFTCQYCFEAEAIVERLRERYGDDLKIVYKHFVMEPERGETPARAACAAHLQDRFLAMKELIWSDAYQAGDLSRERMLALARRLELDLPRFEADLDGTCARVVKEDHEQLERLRNPGTPTFFINGRFVAGAQSIEQFEALIDEELEKARRRIADGTPAERYYATWVLEKGAVAP